MAFRVLLIVGVRCPLVVYVPVIRFLVGSCLIDNSNTSLYSYTCMYTYFSYYLILQYVIFKFFVFIYVFDLCYQEEISGNHTVLTSIYVKRVKSSYICVTNHLCNKPQKNVLKEVLPVIVFREKIYRSSVNHFF